MAQSIRQKQKRLNAASVDLVSSSNLIQSERVAKISVLPLNAATDIMKHPVSMYTIRSVCLLGSTSKWSVQSVAWPYQSLKSMMVLKQAYLAKTKTKRAKERTSF